MGQPAFDIGRHYDRVTAAWTLLLGADLHYGLFSSGGEDLSTATANLTRLMCAEMGVGPRFELLDVGCGTGRPACWLAEVHKVRVTGITTSQAGVDCARARAAESGTGELATFLQRDGIDNGFAGESFDGVWLLESSHLISDRARLLAECYRVLRPGGRLALCDIMLRRPMPFEEVRRLRHSLALLRGVFGNARMESMRTYESRLEHSGFVVQRHQDLTAETQPTFRRWRENAQRFRAEVIELLGQEGWQEFLAACDVLERFWKDETLGYGLIVGTKP